MGRYAVLNELGRGGMGVVYRAYDTTLNRYVAIKMILQSGVGAEVLERFRREAATAARLRHPGIVAVYEVGVHLQRPFIVTELVLGESLERRVAAERPTARRSAELVKEIALALDHAHLNGVVHRDVTPGNVIVDAEGRTHLMDFGLARDETAKVSMTVAGEVLGTPGYMSPEQARGEVDLQGPATDVYALGGLLYRCLGGRPPFMAGTLEATMFQIMQRDPVPLRTIDPAIPLDLETIALRCLAKAPGDRYPSAASVARELERFLDGQAIAARPITTVERASLWVRRNRRLTWTFVAGAAVVVALVAGVLVVLERRQAAEKLREAELIAKLDARQADSEKREHGRLEAVEQFRLAEERSTAKDLDGTIAACARVLALDPLHVQAWHLSAASRQAKLDLDGAIADYGHVIELDAKSPVAWFQRAVVRWQKGDGDGTIADCSHAIELDPKNWNAFYYRAAARQKANDVDGAIADYARATELNPLHDAAWRAQVALQQRKNDLDAAIATLTSEVTAEPKKAASFLARSALRLKKDQLDLAIDDASRAIALEPRNALARCARADARLKKDLPGAIDDYKAAAALNPRLEVAWRSLMTAQHKRGDLAGAIASLTSEIAFDDKKTIAWVHRAQMRNQKGDHKGAVADAERATELDDKSAVAWLTLGNARRDAGDTDGAIAAWRRGVAANPKAEGAWRSLAAALEKKGDLEGAIADLTSEVAVDPKRPAAWSDRAEARLQTNDLEGAVADATRALELSPTAPTPLRIRGTARARRGERDAAIADLERFLKLAPKDPNVPGVKVLLVDLKKPK
jgi:serine/threonine-protein kinase